MGYVFISKVERRIGYVPVSTLSGLHFEDKPLERFRATDLLDLNVGKKATYA